MSHLGMANTYEYDLLQLPRYNYYFQQPIGQKKDSFHYPSNCTVIISSRSNTS